MQFSTSNVAAIIFIQITLACSSTEQIKNRHQQVTDLPYRSFSVPDSLRGQIQQDVNRVLSDLPTADLRLLFRRIDDDEWIFKETSADGVESLRKEALALWESGNIGSTMIIFPSQFTKPMDSRMETVIGVEIEHGSLTGTCMLIVDKENLKPIYFDYIERK